MATYQAGLTYRSWSEKGRPEGWYYVCHCPKADERGSSLWGPFVDGTPSSPASREMARKSASLHNHAYPDHKKG